MRESRGAQRPDRRPSGLSVLAWLAGLIALVALAAWAAHLIRDALDLQIMPENEQHVHRAVMMGTGAYIALMALPFVPGVEIGLGLMAAFGPPAVPLVYCATIVSMMLAYTIGRLLPDETLAMLLATVRLRRAAALVRRTAAMPMEERMDFLLQGAPSRVLSIAMRNRYLALALVVNIPGNSMIGGGGGIMMVAGLTGIFAPLPTLVTVALAVAPLPLAILFLGHQIP